MDVPLNTFIAELLHIILFALGLIVDHSFSDFVIFVFEEVNQIERVLLFTVRNSKGSCDVKCISFFM